MTWGNFQRHFKDKYLTKPLYDEKEKGFHDLKLKKQSMDEFVTKFTYLLRMFPTFVKRKPRCIVLLVVCKIS